MTLEELKYIVAEEYKRRERFIDIDILPSQLEGVEAGEWTDEGKYSYRSDVYKDDQGNHFMIHNNRSGSYYSDYYYGEPEITQVKPVVETITRVVWRSV